MHHVWPSNNLQMALIVVQQHISLDTLQVIKNEMLMYVYKGVGIPLPLAPLPYLECG